MKFQITNFQLLFSISLLLFNKEWCLADESADIDLISTLPPTTEDPEAITASTEIDSESSGLPTKFKPSKIPFVNDTPTSINLRLENTSIFLPTNVNINQSNAPSNDDNSENAERNSRIDISSDQNENIPTNKLSKRILISPTPESNSDRSNIERDSNSSNGQLDSWRPVWPYSKISNIPIRTTPRLPTINVSPSTKHATFIEPSSVVPAYSVSKEPVTAYYFDVSSVVPSNVGPLFDPSQIEAARLNILKTLNPTEITNKNMPNSENINIATSNIQHTPVIQPTPIYSKSITNTENGSSLQSLNEALEDDNLTSVLSATSNTKSTFLNDSTPSGADALPFFTSVRPLRAQNATVETSTVDHFAVNVTEVLPPEDHDRAIIEEKDVDESNITTVAKEATNDASDFLTLNATTASSVSSTEVLSLDVTTPISLDLANATRSSTFSPITPEVLFNTTVFPNVISTTDTVDTAENKTSKTSNNTQLPPQEKKETVVIDFPAESGIGNNEEVRIILSDDPEQVPSVYVTRLEKDGTNMTEALPFLKLEVALNISEFCNNRRQIETLLEQWITSHLLNESFEDNYTIALVGQPDCRHLYILNETVESEANSTSAYFYVKQNGRLNKNATLNFPRDPNQLQNSAELEYLKDKILHLELLSAERPPLPAAPDLASLGPAIIAAIVVSIVSIICVIGAIIAIVLIRKRRSSEASSGRRCVPAANDAYSLDSVSVFYHSLRRKSKKRASNKSLKSYLNQGFEDPKQPSRPLTFAKLTHFISDNEGVQREFSNIPAVNPKYDEMPRGVEDKNRYANVIPVPETRVLLGGNKTSPQAEYINANTIHGPKGELRYYIGTQAPMDNTVCDFWQMVWEQESKVIVMLTDFVEKGIDKCADYLPPSETLDCHRIYGEFQITLKSRDMRDKYIMSLLQIKNLENNLIRDVAHLWYTGWPHVGVPFEEKLFVSFILDVRITRKQLRSKGPIIVHCSPGTGRTGTYIACELCLRQFDDQRSVDVPKTVFQIRRERAGAVQTKQQYAFIYRVVNLYAAKLTTGNLDSF